MGSAYRRYYVTVGDRQVHYRRVGDGPPIILLHASPQTADFVIPAMMSLANEFTLIGLDTPGYGGSDRLGLPEPTAADYADALAETLDALGIRRAPVYGTHTGAHIAMEFGLRFPERTAACFLDGISFNTVDEKQELVEQYAPAFTPVAGGGHLAWAWQHTRDQTIFYPWFRAERDRRVNQAIGDPEYLSKVVLWKMVAGSGYRIGYRAAFTHDSLAAIKTMAVPTLVIARAADILAHQASRLGDLPQCVRILKLPESREQWLVALREAFATANGDRTIPLPPETRAMRGRQWRGYVSQRGGQRLVRCGGGASGRPLVLLHGDMESSATLEDLARGLSRDRSVYALDIAGCADSDPLEDGASLADYVRDASGVCSALGLTEFDVYGRGLGATLALAMARSDSKVKRLVLDQPWAPSAEERVDLLAQYAPALSARWDGTHFLTAWSMLRDRALFWPWYRRTRDAIRWVEPDFDPNDLQRDLVELLKRPQTYGDYCRAMLASDVAGLTPGLTQSCLVLVRTGDRLATHADRLALAHAERRARPSRPSELVDVVADFLRSAR